MASLFQAGDRWVVCQYLGRENGKRKNRTWRFSTKGAAEAFAAANALTFPGIGGSAGRKPRSVQRVVADLAASSALVESGCVEWIGPLINSGYGRFTWNTPDGVIRGAHRVAYHVLVAPVPPDKVIDHLCRNRKCIRPDHLEVVQQRENVMRSPIAMGAINAAKTHCPQGHEYSPENTYTYSLGPPRTTTMRVCKTCRLAYSRRYYAQKKAS